MVNNRKKTQEVAKVVVLVHNPFMTLIDNTGEATNYDVGVATDIAEEGVGGNGEEIHGSLIGGFKDSGVGLGFGTQNAGYNNVNVGRGQGVAPLNL